MSTNASEWAVRVEAWRASGESAKEFCRGREYSPTTLYWWSSQLRRGAVTVKPQSISLARVVRVPTARTSRSSVIVVEVGDARVEVPADVDRGSLSAVFETLIAASSGAR